MEASTGVGQLLAGVAAVPRILLDQLQPDILAALFQELSNSGAAPASSQSGGGGVFRMQSREADARLTLLLLLVRMCWEAPRFHQAGGDAFFLKLLQDPDARVRQHTAVFLQQHLQQQFPQQFQRGLRKLVRQAQQQNDLNLLHNAFLQVSTLVDSQLIDIGL